MFNRIPQISAPPRFPAVGSRAAVDQPYSDEFRRTDYRANGQPSSRTTSRENAFQEYEPLSNGRELRYDNWRSGAPLELNRNPILHSSNSSQIPEPRDHRLSGSWRSGPSLSTFRSDTNQFSYDVSSGPGPAPYRDRRGGLDWTDSRPQATGRIAEPYVSPSAFSVGASVPLRDEAWRRKSPPRANFSQTRSDNWRLNEQRRPSSYKTNESRHASEYRNDKKAAAPSARLPTRGNNTKVESTRHNTTPSETQRKEKELEEAAKVQMEMVAALEEKALQKEKNEKNAVDRAEIADTFKESLPKKIDTDQERGASKGDTRSNNCQMEQTVSNETQRRVADPDPEPSKDQLESASDIGLNDEGEDSGEMYDDEGYDEDHPQADKPNPKISKQLVISNANFEDIHLFHLKGKSKAVSVRPDVVQSVLPGTAQPVNASALKTPYTEDSWFKQYQNRTNQLKSQANRSAATVPPPSTSTRSPFFFNEATAHRLPDKPAEALPPRREPILPDPIPFAGRVQHDRLDDRWHSTSGGGHLEASSAQHKQIETLYAEPHQTVASKPDDLDPQDFVEALSDMGDDWNEVVSLLTTSPTPKFPLKRPAPANMDSERPRKTGLLGGPPVGRLGGLPVGLLGDPPAVHSTSLPLRAAHTLIPSTSASTYAREPFEPASYQRDAVFNQHSVRPLEQQSSFDRYGQDVDYFSRRPSDHEHTYGRGFEPPLDRSSRGSLLGDVRETSSHEHTYGRVFEPPVERSSRGSLLGYPSLERQPSSYGQPRGQADREMNGYNYTGPAPFDRQNHPRGSHY